MSGYFSNGFIDFMLKCKRFSYHRNVFFPNEYENNDEIIISN